MKKILIFLSLVLLSGCTSSEQADNSKPQVYTSFYCIYDFAQKIGGDKIDIYNVVPTGTEPHDWEPTAHDMAALSDADVLIYNGLGMESWIDKVTDSIDINTVALSDYVDTDDENDPHIWLDPENAKDMARGIYNVFCEIDSENVQYYTENYNAFSEKLDRLDERFETELKSYENREIVVSHEAYGYMCKAYDLKQVAIDGISADSEPSPQKMKEIVDLVNSKNIKVIFYEELVSKKTAQTIADETNAVLLPLNPFEGLTDEEIAAGMDYISVMEENLDNLKIALEK